MSLLVCIHDVCVGRLSLCSETYHHECLYSWHYEDITVPEIPDHILLLIVSETGNTNQIKTVNYNIYIYIYCGN